MKYLPQNTLAYFNSAPQYHRHDLSGLPTSVFGASTKKYRMSCGESFPNDEALSFYALNHLASIVRKKFTPNEPLPVWAKEVLDTYLTVASGQGLRMLHYVLSICTREMRHLKLAQVSSTWGNEVTAQFGQKFRDFLSSICAVGETEAVNKYMTHPPDVPIGKYIAGLAYGFHKGKWNGGYGGKKWGEVADACSAFIHGKNSMETLVDTGYTLAHNNGPIFNKGMMYTSYDSAFITILDVQRSGQIPDLILDTAQFGVQKTEVAKKAVTLVRQNMPNEFRGWVDWFLVEKLGAVNKYDSYKTQQKKLHPVTVEEKKVLEKVLHGKKIKMVGDWNVFPGQVVQVFERVSQ